MSRKDNEATYRELIAQGLPRIGFPPYPPTELPPQTLWWKHTTSVYPTHSQNPYSRFLGLDGLPAAGRSTVEAAIENKLPVRTKLHGLKWQITHIPEIYSKTSDTFSSALLPPQLQDHEDEFGLLDTVTLDREWFTPWFMQANKVLWWESFFKDYSLPAAHSDRSLFIGYRSPLDCLAWYYALASHTTDSQFAIPSDMLENDALLASALAMTLKMDVVFLHGIDRSTSRRRRRSRQPDNKGWVTESPFFSDLSRWYGHIVGHVLPHLHQIHGTGYAVVSGQDPIEQKVNLVMDQINAVTNPLRVREGRPI